MTPFEFVFSLISIIASLALTHLVSGVALLIRTPRRSRPSWFLLLWIWTAFATTVGNWGGNWDVRQQHSFAAWQVLTVLALMISQYAFCAFVIPAREPEVEAPDEAERQRERARYIGAFIVLLLIAIAANVASGLTQVGMDGVWMSIYLSAAQILVAVVALKAPWAWARIAASGLIAVLSTYWMVAACEIVAST